MRAYKAILKQQMIAQMQYRTGFWAQMSSHIFWGVARAAILAAFYLYGQGDAAITLSQAVSMVWLQQLSGVLIPGWNTDVALWNQLRTGDVGYELLRPMDVYAHWYAKAIASRIGPFLLSIAPVALIGSLIPAPWGLGAPASFAHLLACAATLMSGVVLSCSVILISYAMVMDVRVGPSPANIITTVVQILSGLYLPLQLWPQGMQKFLYYQPFAGLLDLPLRLYVGAEPLARTGEIALLQLGWAAVFILLGRAWIGRNFKKIVIQGG